MGNIYLTSDLHFGHDREFVWKVRGYDSVQAMNLVQV
jgi:calcineurin-like phosphoesterase family protein